ncbi:MAG: S9 family peptidase, partial [Bacteroidetes bacterium]|nr:S9 family peptidase [Bacteroidota bacterium]
AKSTLLKAEKFIPNGLEKPIRFSNYTWSEDFSKLLLFTNTKRVWRANTRGDYWIYDLSRDTLFHLGESLPESSMMFAKFSSDGTRVVFVSQHNIYMQILSNMKIRQFTFDGTDEIINGTFDWVYEEEFDCRDGFRMSHDGNYIAFWQLDATGTKNFLMINNTDSLYSYTIPVQYPKVGEPPSAAKVGYIDVQTGKINWISIPGEPRDNYIPRMQWVGNTNKLLIRQINRKQNEENLWVYDVMGADLKKIYTEKDEAWIDIDHPDVAQTRRGMSDIDFLNNETEFIWFSEKDGWRHLYRKSIANEKEILLTPGNYDVAALYGTDEKKGLIYFNASPENSTQRYLYSIDLKGSGKIKRITPLELQGINTYDCAPGMLFAVHSFTSHTNPRTVNLIGLPGHNTIKNLVKNEIYRKKMEELALGSMEFFKVTTEDGIEMDGYMVKPPDFDPNKKYPVFFELYGEPWGATAIDTWGNLWHHRLAQLGYIVMTLDNRGTPCLKGREWRKSIYRKIGVNNSRDQAMATREILKWKFIDPERIAVWGWSGGGSMTLNLMFRYPEIYKTGIAVAAVSNQLYYDNIYTERYMGLPQENPDDFTQASPLTFANNLEGNLLVVHGTADDNVHYQNAEALILELVKHNKQFQMMAYPNCSHGIYEIEGATTHLFTLIEDFLLKNTPPGGK